MAQIIILVVKVILICVSFVNNLKIIPIEKEIPDDTKYVLYIKEDSL